jgi:hypothetical protein
VEVGSGSASNTGISKGSAYSFQPALAIAKDNTPYVIWGEHLNGIYVLRWNGEVWEEVGKGSASGSGMSQGYGSLASIAIDSDNHPYVAWTANHTIYVRHWNGSSWEEIGEGSASDDGITGSDILASSPSITVSPDGIPYITWGAITELSAIYIRQGPATLATLPTTLGFFMQPDTAPLTKQIHINSTVNGISWTATMSPTVPWLSITPNSGTTPAVITVTATISDTTFGIYDTHIIVKANEGTLNSPQTIGIRLIMTEDIFQLCLPVILKNN